MKKILVFLNSMTAAGGIERVVANLANAWSKKYEITILVKDKGDSFYPLNNKIKIESLGVPLFLDMNSRRKRVYSLVGNLVKNNLKLKKYFVSSNYDYIYVTTPFNALEICLLGKGYLDKLVISEHGSKLGYNKYYKLLKKIIYPKAYRISVPTTMDVNLYIDEGCAAVYIPHLSTFSAKQKNQLDSKLVINIGRLTSDKQQLMLLKIWNNVAKKDMLNGWKLQIIGKGEEEKKLLDFIQLNGLNNSVEIIPPSLAVEKIYQKASLFAFTSKFEGFGMVLLEAMSFGIPCISFDCPSGPRDIIKEGLNGFLISCYNMDRYESQLAVLLKNENRLIDTLGENSFSMVANWSNSEILEMWDAVFQGGT